MSKCVNCDRELTESSNFHRGYGAGSGEVSSGVNICPLCNEGCYKWEKDDIPGFRSSDKYPCCKCGKTP